MEESIDFDDNASVVSPFESIKVVVRVRPLNIVEGANPLENNSSLNITSPTTLSVTTNDHRKAFQCGFDHVLGPTTTQAQVYDVLKECTHAVFQGVNSTIFAYGQTGSGKTHSMYGPPNYITKQSRETELLGIIPRVIHHIFELAKHPNILQLQVHCSFVQIYNENLYDMLRDPSMNTPLAIREDKEQKEIFVQGLSEYHVQNVHDTLQLLTLAEEHRVIRETHMNQASSRSHSIFQIFVEQKRIVAEDQEGGMQGEVVYKAKFNLVDLAGSEKWDVTSTDSKKSRLSAEHIQEMNNINLSLHTLGKCISALARASRKKQKELQKQAQQQSMALMSEDDNQSVTKASNGLRSTKENFSLSASLSTASLFSTSQLPPPGTASGSSSSNIHIPYRESKLTRLLQDSLGGNAKTFLLATLSPAKDNVDETISTLKFADRAKQVMIAAKTNEIRPYDHMLAQRLQQEVTLWKSVWKKLLAFSPLHQACQQYASQLTAHLMTTSSSVSFSAMRPSGMMLTEAEITHWQQQLWPLVQSIVPSLTATTTGPAAITAASASASASASAPLSITTTNLPQPGDLNHQEEEDSPLLGSNIPHPQSTTTSPTKPTAPTKKSVDPESSLAYVMSLEKTLNQEQITNQHLQKKNETLIKEIEFLKTRDLQHTLQTTASTTATSVSSGFPEGAVWSPPVLQAAVDHHLVTLDTATTYTTQSHKTLEDLQGIMKQFFKFQIEEEEMKDRITSVFAKSLSKEEKKKQGLLLDQMKECKDWLQQLLQTTKAQATATTNANASASAAVNTMNNTLLPRQQQLLQQSQSLLSVAPTSGPSNPNYLPNNHLSLQPHPSQLSPIRASSKKPTSSSSSSSTTPAHRSEVYDPNTNINTNVLNINTTMSSKKSLRATPHQQHHLTHSQSEAAFVDGMEYPGASSQGALSQGITYRVRGGGGNAASHAPAPSSVNNHPGDESVWSSADHLQALLHTDETEEERLKREYKESLKRQKKKEKLQAWLKEKEDRQQQELKAQEEEKKAMQDAEYQRELKRREYAQKQKQKLLSYQDKLKQETDKIQELINLGIDPASLNLS